ncbi:MAG TPA: acyl carrier protein [Gammaproteobacteria bacterium]|nr:acyl carrier protein [Gammaproteobacteria bacterium]
MDREQLVSELKQLVIDECEKDIAPDGLSADAQLIGKQSPLELDSLDALQISLAVKQRYGKAIEGGNKGRKVLASINSLADFILA